MNMVPIEEMDLLVSRLLDRGLSDSEASRLNALLSDSPDARDRYQELLDNQEALYTIYPGDIYASNVAEWSETALEPDKARTQPMRVSFRRFLWGATAATVLITSMIMILSGRKGDETPLPGDTAASIAPVARLVAAVDADWLDAEPLPGPFLEAGNFQLEVGTVELEFYDGARVTLRGPAAFELKSENHLHVLSGSMVAHIPEEALGFTVTTSQSEFVDLGTEFGLSVDVTGQTDVHVIDGLVEVYKSRNLDEPTEAGASQTGVKIREGQARRLTFSDGELQFVDIPFASRNEILGSGQYSDLGLSLLRGSIRLRDKDTVSEFDLEKEPSGKRWIEIIPENTGVLLEEETEVTLRSPGNYRFFGASGQMIPAGTRVDSYLLHFRSTDGKPIRGVIKFDRPIVGLVCEANQLAKTDPFLGLEGVSYSFSIGKYRGLEPHFNVEGAPPDTGGGWTPDEVTLSQDMKTLGLRVNVYEVRGVDQLRVLTLSKD